MITDVRGLNPRCVVFENTGARVFTRYAMDNGSDTLQFVWIAGHKREHPRHQDYYAEVVERLTSVTPEIDERVATMMRQSVSHTRSSDRDRSR